MSETLTAVDSSLAVRGGPRAVAGDRKHFEWPIITDRTSRVVAEQLHRSISIYDRSGIIAELEDSFSKFHGTKRSLLTSSGTAALHSAFVGVGLGPGDEILCPAYTFYATITPIFFTGAVPVLIDCLPDGNISPGGIERAITPRTKAIVVTHMWGIPCDMVAIAAIARKHGLRLIEDGSHAHGATIDGQPVGSFGDVSCFSLQGQKTVTGGEGGVLCTSDDEVYYRALLLGHYNKRCKSEIPKSHPLARFATTGMGLKLRIHPIAAAVAKQQFDELDVVLAGRRKCAAYLAKRLAGVPGINLPIIRPGSEPSWYAFVFQYDPDELGGLPVDKFHEAVVAEGCNQLDRPGATCPLNLHPLFQDPAELFPAYRGKLSYKAGDFPAAEEIYRNALKLPVWHREEDFEIVDGYISAIRKVASAYRELL